MTYLFITPLLIDFFVSIWYTIWIVVAGMIYIGIFKYFTKIGGRKEAAKLLGAPGVPINKAMRRYKDADSGLLSFIGYWGNNQKQRIIKADEKWIKSFCEVCHWCGYQVVIRKDSDTDIENKDSKAYDEKLIQDISEKHFELNDKSINKIKQSKQHLEDVKSKFKL